MVGRALTRHVKVRLQGIGQPAALVHCRLVLETRPRISPRVPRGCRDLSYPPHRHQRGKLLPQSCPSQCLSLDDPNLTIQHLHRFEQKVIPRPSAGSSRYDSTSSTAHCLTSREVVRKPVRHSKAPRIASRSDFRFLTSLHISPTFCCGRRCTAPISPKSERCSPQAGFLIPNDELHRPSKGEPSRRFSRPHAHVVGTLRGRPWPALGDGSALEDFWTSHDS